MKIKIGTRGSKLALWQANLIADMLSEQGIESELITINTKGDKIQEVSLSKIGSKGLFTEELEDQLRNNEIDIAVHSAKDIQSDLPDDLQLIAFSERENADDVLVSFKKDIVLNNQGIIGTSSTRRVAFLKYYFPDINIVDMRGNLQTRFDKMKNGDCDSMILAYAGVHRMGYDSTIVKHFPLDQFIPQAGQGSIAIQCHKRLEKVKKDIIYRTVNHHATETCITAERSFLKTMDGGCSIPTFVHSYFINEREILVKGGIISLDGKQICLNYETGLSMFPEQLGRELAGQILQNGGKKILDVIKGKLS